MRSVDRYIIYDEIAAGGMASVCFGRLRGETGFSRVVAIKILHAHFAKEDAFRAMFLDEARLVSRIRHPNVVATLDVLQDAGELFLVMEYIHGETLARLLQASQRAQKEVPLPIASAIMVDLLEGLHAAHEARAEDGTALDIVHRDVSPHNVLIGLDGTAHVADFGIAKAAGRLAEKFSMEESVKGKAGYMSPEQVRGKVDRRTDIYASGVVLWEMIAGRRLFSGSSFVEILTQTLDATIAPPSSERADVPPTLDDVVLKALQSDAKERFATARDMALAIERAAPIASAREVGAWVAETAKDAIARKRELIARLERDAMVDEAAPAATPPAEDPAAATLREIGTLPGVAPPVRNDSPRRPVRAWAAVAIIPFVLAGVTLVWTFARARAVPAVVSSAAPAIPSLSVVSVAPSELTRSIERPTATASALISAPTVATTPLHREVAPRHVPPPPSAALPSLEACCDGALRRKFPPYCRDNCPPGT